MKKISLITAWHEGERDFYKFLDYLESIQEIYNELIIVCNGEKTLEIKKNISNKIKISKIVEKDFSKIRNEGIKNIDSGNTHCLLLDPDERLDQTAYESIKALKLKKNTLYYIDRKNLFNGTWYRFTFPKERQYRLIPSSAKFVGSVHERIVTVHDIEKVNGLIVHEGYKNWTEAIKKYNFYIEMESKRNKNFRSYLKFIYNIIKCIKNYLFFGCLDGSFGLRWLMHQLKFWGKCLKIKIIQDLNG